MTTISEWSSAPEKKLYEIKYSSIHAVKKTVEKHDHFRME